MTGIITLTINEVKFNIERVYPGHGFTTFRITFDREEGRNSFYMIKLWNSDFSINQKFGLPQNVLNSEPTLSKELTKLVHQSDNYIEHENAEKNKLIQ